MPGAVVKPGLASLGLRRWSGWGSAALFLLALLAGPAAAQEKAASPPLRIALTFDDLPAHGPLPPGVTRTQVAQQVIDALKAAGAPATGFVNGGFGVDDADSPEVLKLWRAAGLPLGNHTFSHGHLDQMGAKAFLADLDRDEPFLKGEPKRLRFPFLEEGRDPEVRDAVRAGLAKRGYRIAAVTLSFDDYAYNEPYVRCLAQGNEGAVKALEARYIAAARTDAFRARTISQAALRRDVPQVLLLHIGVLTAKMLPRLIAQYRAMGFTFSSLDEAESDPFYAAVDPARPGPSSTLGPLEAKVKVPLPDRLPMPGNEICPAK